MASTHGGRYHASPYTVSQTPLPPQPSELDQFELRRKFFDYHLKGKLIPCLNLPTFPMTPLSLMCGIIFFFLKIENITMLIKLLIEYKVYL